MTLPGIAEFRSLEFGTKVLPQLGPDKWSSKTGLARSYPLSKDLYVFPTASTWCTFHSLPLKKGRTNRQGCPGFVPSD